MESTDVRQRRRHRSTTFDQRSQRSDVVESVDDSAINAGVQQQQGLQYQRFPPECRAARLFPEVRFGRSEPAAATTATAAATVDE